MFKVRISLDIDTDDGEPFFNSHVEYAAMPYPAMVLIERKMVDLLSDLVAEAEKQLAAAAK